MGCGGNNLSVDDSCIEGSRANNTQLTADPFDPILGPPYLADNSPCLDTGDATTMDAAYSRLNLDWRDGSTLASGAKDTPPPDPGYHAF